MDQTACFVDSFDNHSRASVGVVDPGCISVMGSQHLVLLESSRIFLRSLSSLVLARLYFATSRSGMCHFLMLVDVALRHQLGNPAIVAAVFPQILKCHLFRLSGVSVKGCNVLNWNHSDAALYMCALSTLLSNLLLLLCGFRSSLNCLISASAFTNK